MDRTEKDASNNSGNVSFNVFTDPLPGNDKGKNIYRQTDERNLRSTPSKRP
jgi:hypothetical protein